MKSRFEDSFSCTTFFAGKFAIRASKKIANQAVLSFSCESTMSHVLSKSITDNNANRFPQYLFTRSENEDWDETRSHKVYLFHFVPLTHKHTEHARSFLFRFQLTINFVNQSNEKKEMVKGLLKSLTGMEENLINEKIFTSSTLDLQL